MGHHSHLDIAGHGFLYSGGGYLPELAALFTESDRRVLDHGDEGTEFAYATTVASLRERLQVQGFTVSRYRVDLAKALQGWARKLQKPAHSSSSPTTAEAGDGADQRGIARPTTIQEWTQQSDLTAWISRVPTVREIEDEVERRLATNWDVLSFEDLPVLPDPDPLHELTWFMSHRSFVRLLLEFAPDPCAEVCLDLSDLTGCCVELPADLSVAGDARAEQLAHLSQNAPLLVLTEGVTDARLLSAGMEITHPHLKGFISFFDHVGGNAEGGVNSVAKTVSAFIAAGVANRFIALVDNDTEGHAGLSKLKQQTLPDRCRIAHYPSLPLLEAYPTLGPTSELPILADLNGLAGSLEMYLGRDVLEGDDGNLMPVQWKAWNPKLRRYQGTLLDDDKKTAQDRFMEKVRAHKDGRAAEQEDWSGICAIIDTIVNAFE